MTAPIGPELAIPFLIGEGITPPVASSTPPDPVEPQPEHLALPFNITKAGAKTNQQGSAQDVQDSVLNICLCPEGTREDNSQFGIPELTWEVGGLDLRLLEEAIRRWEPGAPEEAVEQALSRRERIVQVLA